MTKNDSKFGGPIYIRRRRRRRRTAVGGASLTEFIFRLIFGWRITFGGDGQIRRSMGLVLTGMVYAAHSTITCRCSRRCPGVSHQQLSDHHLPLPCRLTVHKQQVSISYFQKSLYYQQWAHTADCRLIWRFIPMDSGSTEKVSRLPLWTGHPTISALTFSSGQPEWAGTNNDRIIITVFRQWRWSVFSIYCEPQSINNQTVLRTKAHSFSFYLQIFHTCLNYFLLCSRINSLKLIIHALFHSFNKLIDVIVILS